MLEIKNKNISAEDLIKILGLTIKRDETNKLITFLAMLSVYTEDAQINVSFNAPSSSGKSFIPLEIAHLFPKEDVIKLGSCSPTAFFHEQGEYDKETNKILVDLSKKIIIFMDQPNSDLLKRLRSLLSHDEKEIESKITDKNQKGGNRTKTVVIRGYPSVIFCSASLMFDEQESTRFLLLSPEINQDKIRKSIIEKIARSSDSERYGYLVNEDPERVALIERIMQIKEEGIGLIKVNNPTLVKAMFFDRCKAFKPRHQRDISRIINLVKIFALVNLWNRERDNNTLVTNDDDILEAFKIWDAISESQELNLPPYVFNLYKDVVLVAFEEKNRESVSGVKIGLTRNEIMQKHFSIYNRYLPDWQLRQHIIPLLETSGLVTQEPDENDKRKILIYPSTSLTVSPDENYSESQGGVDEEEQFIRDIEEVMGS